MSFEVVNNKVVRASVSPAAPVLARRGAMLAYVGSVAFSPVSSGAGGSGFGGGIGAAVGRTLAGESVSLMVAQGDGQVLYGFAGRHVHLVHLDGAQLLTAEASRLVAYSAQLSTSVVPVSAGGGGARGLIRGAVTGQGLFTTQISGAGDVALLAHGGVFELEVSDRRPVTVDPQAFVATLGPVRVELGASAGWKEMRSGEAFQLHLSGSGRVLVQASEEKL